MARIDADTDVPARPRANAAVAIATLALIVAVIGLVVALGARNRADGAVDIANKTKTFTEETVDKAVNEASKATPGGGVSPDNPVPAGGSGELYPDANGQ